MMPQLPLQVWKVRHRSCLYEISSVLDIEFLQMSTVDIAPSYTDHSDSYHFH